MDFQPVERPGRLLSECLALAIAHEGFQCLRARATVAIQTWWQAVHEEGGDSAD